MIDRFIRPLIDPPLNAMARALSSSGLKANQVTLAGLGVGLGSVVAVCLDAMGAALILLLLNRLADGLDGALARLKGPTEFGGYLDIVSDFALWALLPIGFALLDPANALAAAVLLASFIGTGTTFLAHAILAAKAGEESIARGKKSFFHLGGLTEGAETIAFFALVMVWPGLFIPAAFIFAAMAAITALMRVLETHRLYHLR